MWEVNRDGNFISIKIKMDWNGIPVDTWLKIPANVWRRITPEGNRLADEIEAGRPKCLYCLDEGTVKITLPVRSSPFKGEKKFTIPCPGPVCQRKTEEQNEIKAEQADNTCSEVRNFEVRKGDRFVTIRVGNHLQDMSPAKAREVAAEIYHKANDITTEQEYRYNESLAAMEEPERLLEDYGDLQIWKNRKDGIFFVLCRFHEDRESVIAGKRDTNALNKGESLPATILALGEKK